MKLSKQIFHGVLLSNVVTIVEMVVGLTQHIILVRFILGIRDFGTLGFFQAGFGILAIFFNLNLNNSAIRYGGAAVAKNDEQEFYSIQGTAFVITLALNLLLLAVTLAFAAIGFEYKGRIVGEYYFLLAVNTIINLAGGLAVTLYTTRKQFRLLTIQQIMSTVVGAIFLLIVAWQIRTVRGAMYGMITGSTAVAIISLWMVRHDLFRLRVNFKLARAFSAYGSGFALTSIVKQFFWNADVVLLGLFTTDKLVGLYRIAQTVANPLMRVFSPLWTVLFPTISIESARGNVEGIKKLLTRGTQWLVLGNLPIVIVGSYLLDFVIPRLYGGAVGAIFPIRMLLWGYVIGTMTSVSPPVLRVYRNDLAFWTTFFAAILNILLNLILIPRFGIRGAALASFISFGLLALAVYYYAFRAVHIPVLPLLSAPVCAQILLIGLMMVCSIMNYFWAALGFYCVLLLFLFGYKMVSVAELKTYVAS